MIAAVNATPIGLFEKHRRNGIPLDSNLLLLLVLGGLDVKLIGRGRISHFTSEDFRKLNETVASFRVRFTTPNILTEVDDLGRKDVKGREQKFRGVLKELELTMIEEFVPSRSVLCDAGGEWLGLADTAILKIEQPFLLLTTDANLWGKAARSKIDAVNWNHLRQQWL